MSRSIASAAPGRSRAWASSPRRFPGRRVESLPGDIAIGHTRYSTAGSSTIENAQPVLARFRDGHIALAHNGNLTNATELRRELEDGGSIFTSTMDSEVLVHRIARSRSPTSRSSGSPTRSRDVEGAYSLVVVDRRHAARRARPARLASARDRASSATRPCSRRRPARSTSSGATIVREVERGEIVAVDAKECDRVSRSRRRSRASACSSTSTSRGRTAGSSAARWIARAAQLGRRLARDFPRRRADLVFSVPDSSNSAALGFAEESGLPFELALIRNHYVGRTFIQPTQAGRDAKVKVKYNAVREVLEGKSVVMVDDSIVRGTTTRGLVAMVRAAGAREVHMRVSSSPVTGPCYYGIDTPTREELIAANMSSRRDRGRSSASTRSAICRSTECSSRFPADRTGSATRASPATIRRRLPPTRRSSASAAAADR